MLPHAGPGRGCKPQLGPTKGSWSSPTSEAQRAANPGDCKVQTHAPAQRRAQMAPLHSLEERGRRPFPRGKSVHFSGALESAGGFSRLILISENLGKDRRRKQSWAFFFFFFFGLLLVASGKGSVQEVEIN